MKPRERRTRRIRRYVVATTVTLFLAVWSVVYTEMRAGDDPALTSGTAVATATQSTNAATTATDDDSSGDDGGTSSGSISSGSTSSAPAPVTTQQS